MGKKIWEREPVDEERKINYPRERENNDTETATNSTTTAATIKRIARTSNWTEPLTKSPDVTYTSVMNNTQTFESL